MQAIDFVKKTRLHEEVKAFDVSTEQVTEEIDRLLQEAKKNEDRIFGLEADYMERVETNTTWSPSATRKCSSGWRLHPARTRSCKEA